MPLEDISKGQGMDYIDFLAELEAIVLSGTRIDLNYYIEDIIDEEGKEEIFDYFKSENSGDVK